MFEKITRIFSTVYMTFLNWQHDVNGTGLLSTNTNGNLLTNTNGASLTITTIDLTDGNFTVNNSGTINQSGNFLNIDTGSAFNNLATGVWNWSYVPGTLPDVDLATELTCSAAGNTFRYNGDGAQTVLGTVAGKVYHHLEVSSTAADIKTMDGALDVNGNLTISGVAQLDVSATTPFNIRLAGNWTATSTNPDPFVQHTATVTFDGTSAQTLRNQQRNVHTCG